MRKKMIYVDEELEILIKRIESSSSKSFSRVVKEAIRLWIDKNLKGQSVIEKDPYVLLSEALEIMKRDR